MVYNRNFCTVGGSNRELMISFSVLMRKPCFGQGIPIIKNRLAVILAPRSRQDMTQRLSNLRQDAKQLGGRLIICVILSNNTENTNRFWRQKSNMTHEWEIIERKVWHFLNLASCYDFFNRYLEAIKQTLYFNCSLCFAVLGSLNWSAKEYSCLMEHNGNCIIGIYIAFKNRQRSLRSQNS